MIDANNPKLKTWVDIPENSDFPIQNIPFGIYKSEKKDPRVCAAVGDYIIDLAILAEEGFFDQIILLDPSVFYETFLNPFLEQGRDVVGKVRNRLAHLLEESNTELRTNKEIIKKTFILQKEVQMLMPIKIGDYTDFYSSIEHATNVGAMFRGRDNALFPNWRHLPVGYHGRASSIFISGTPVYRPRGQFKNADVDSPVFGLSKKLDFELEVAFITCKSTSVGQSIPIDKTDEYIAGMVLFNDWSARDIQQWEYVPLGPFLGKSFASSISPWLITMDALEPFKVEGPKQQPEVLPYLQTSGARNFDIELEVFIQPENSEATKVVHSNLKYLYWNINQQLAHQTVNGCNVNVGDIYASGTISGSGAGSYGSLLEITQNGTKPMLMSDGSERTFLLDGDTVIMKGYGKKNGVRIGFGEVTGRITVTVNN